jgi:hypothetical protein
MSHIKFRRELVMALVGISVKVVVHPQEENFNVLQPAETE